ncbi:MAG: M23 family metallopeptidase [Firmicutes bacterium]|nr:M23 family metallopeptidase [Bacillota bacterium]
MLKKVLLTVFAVFLLIPAFSANASAYETNISEQQSSFIKWVDFNASEDMLKKVYKLDVKYHNTDVEFNFIEVLAYLATKNGNNFSSSQDNKNLKALIKRLENKEKVSQIYGDNKYYNYYLECFSAVFQNFIGEYITDNNEVQYGLTAYFPIAKGFWHSHYDDFGNARNFGYKRPHLGHDLMGSTGTPIIAIESGIVTELGWNRYGGWRIGIRSQDTKRYYYYAHLRKDRPYAEGLKLNDVIEAGQVIGYLGQTGYSSTENVNMKTGKPHLHLGLQLIFDKSQEDGNGEIWIDLFNITKLLYLNQAGVTKDEETKEYKSVNIKKPINKFLEGYAL